MELKRIAVARAVARIGLVVAAGVALTAGATLAASHTAPAVPAETPSTTTAAAPATLVVPDVRRLAFVFAKGELEDAGFAWRVRGKVQGYPANLVATQTPAAGTHVVDNGAPLVTLTLKKAPGYPQTGEPDNRSPYAASRPRPARSN